jgi:tetratricopeptide (TPR) repeat protein
MQMSLKAYIPIFCFLIPALVGGQNTIGGQKVIVPEAEVNRQSDFVNAEKERLLGHLDKAIDQYKQFTYQNPAIDAGWYGLARTYAAKEDFPNALQSILKAVEIDPNNTWYREFQALLYEKTNRARDAVDIYAELYKTHPKNIDYLKQQAYLSLMAEDPKGALKALDKLELLTGINPETSSKKHLIYLKMGDSRKAAQELQKLADAYPTRLEYRRQLARFYEDSGDQAAAKKTYEDILRVNPKDPDAQLALADKGKGGSDVDHIHALLPAAGDPQVSLDAKIKQVLPYLSGGNTPRDPAVMAALLEVTQSMEKAHPNDPKAVSLTGAVLYQSNRHAEALEKYRQYIKLNPNVFSVWENALSILQELKQYDEMLKVAGDAIDAYPNQPRAYLYYGIAATEKGKYDDALNQLNQAALMSGNTPVMADILDQTGVTLLRKKDLASAKTNFEKGLAKFAAHPGLLEHYGDALYQGGDKKGAASSWQKAYDITKNPAILDKIKGI